MCKTSKLKRIILKQESNGKCATASWTYWLKKVLYYQVLSISVLTRVVTNVSQTFLAVYVINDLKMSPSSKAMIPAIIYLSSFIASVLLQVLFTIQFIFNPRASLFLLMDKVFLLVVKLLYSVLRRSCVTNLHAVLVEALELQLVMETSPKNGVLKLLYSVPRSCVTNLHAVLVDALELQLFMETSPRVRGTGFSVNFAPVRPQF